MKHLGSILTGVWLLMTGIIQLFHLHFNGIALAMGVLAMVAGVLMVVRH